MTLLKTLLGAAALCAAFLSVLGFVLGPDHRDPPAHPLGLTAATVLASDGMGPDGRRKRPAPRPERIVVGSAEGAGPAG